MSPDRLRSPIGSTMAVFIHYRQVSTSSIRHYFRRVPSGRPEWAPDVFAFHPDWTIFTGRIALNENPDPRKDSPVSAPSFGIESIGPRSANTGNDVTTPVTDVGRVIKLSDATNSEESVFFGAVIRVSSPEEVQAIDRLL